MANEEHLTMLRRGVNVWNDWRKKHPDIRPDLYGADLRETDLVLVNFCRADLNHADLSYADLSFADLSYADLSFAIFSYADLSGANLTESVLYRAILFEANLCSADLHQADLSEADFTRVDLTGANLRAAVLNHTNLLGAITEQATLGNNPGNPKTDEDPIAIRRNVQSELTPSDDFTQPPVVTNGSQPPLDADHASRDERQSDRFTIAEGLTEALFNRELYISVKATNPDTASFMLGSVGQPSLAVDAAKIGDKTLYLDKFEVYLVSVGYDEATFLVNRVGETSSAVQEANQN